LINSVVVPGRREAASPEPSIHRRWLLDSGQPRFARLPEWRSSETRPIRSPGNRMTQSDTPRKFARFDERLSKASYASVQGGGARPGRPDASSPDRLSGL